MTEAPQPASGDGPGQPPSSGAPGQPPPSEAPGPDPAASAPPPYTPPQYPPPPAGGYPGGPGVPPPGYPSADDKTWALVAHFGGAAGMFFGAGCGGWLAPLIALLARGNQSPAARAHAVAALNFQLLWSIIGIVGWIFTCILIGFVAVFGAIAMGTIFGIVAGIRANEGQFYQYPASVNIVK